MTLRECMTQARQKYIRELYEVTGGSASKAAPIAGVERTRIYMLWAEIGKARAPPSAMYRSKRYVPLASIPG